MVGVGGVVVCCAGVAMGKKLGCCPCHEGDRGNRGMLLRRSGGLWWLEDGCSQGLL